MQHFLVLIHRVMCNATRIVTARARINRPMSMPNILYHLALGIDTQQKINIVLIGHEKRERGSHLPGKSVTRYYRVT